MYKLVVLLSVAAMAAAKPSLVAPVAYSAVVPASSSVSQYSSSVVHGSPAVGVVAPAVYSAPSVYSVPALYGAHAVAPVALAQAPHSPAVVLDAVNGVPLDTPEVVAARAAHYQAKALSGFHHLKKRSVGVAPVAYSSVAYSSPLVSAYSSPAVVSAYSAPVVSGYSAYSPLVSAYSHPLSYSAVYPKALSVHPY
ncbi:unnamed protein product [Spodoptera littoralis]|uniref:Uncharacterized protein n=1 Tax=Spodoptera littoralis TaxID=7109 RepID=A0A9P0I047_SPOLI|nr:unnamed protein product [Spodoptera littoralis]CAH1638739.1 unnamed protein product [Spodoptera littoralis]